MGPPKWPPAFWRRRYIERVMGIGPTSPPWEGGILPVNYTRNANTKLYSLEGLIHYKTRPVNQRIKAAVCIINLLIQLVESGKYYLFQDLNHHIINLFL